MERLSHNDFRACIGNFLRFIAVFRRGCKLRNYSYMEVVTSYEKRFSGFKNYSHRLNKEGKRIHNFK